MAALLGNLGVLHMYLSQSGDSERRLKRSLAITEKILGPEHPYVGSSLNSMAELYRVTGRMEEAEPLYRRALAISEKAFGPNHGEVAKVLNNLALLHEHQGRYAEAEQFYKRSLTIAEGYLGPNHPDLSRVFENLASLHLAQQQWTTAAAYLKQSTDLIIRRVKRGADTLGPSEAKSDAERQRFWRLVKVVHRGGELETTGGQERAREMFKTAQWAQSSEASAALAQMAARQAKSGDLAKRVRERQDLVREWQVLDKRLFAAVSLPPIRRNPAAEQVSRVRLTAIDTRLAEVDKALAMDFPEYDALASPEPLDISEIQVLLRHDEALLLFLDTPGAIWIPQETFLWVVTKTDMRWISAETGTEELTRDVVALRCGLDHTAWYGEGASRCGEVLGISINNAPKDNDPLPFNQARAHKLYRALFGEVEDLIKGKHLLIVPSGPLTQLPFHVLVTETPDQAAAGTDALRRTAWLAKSNAITVLPAVSSLKALREHAKSSQATKALIGFGNPLLDGPDATYGMRAETARAKQSCLKAPGQRLAGFVAAGMKTLQQRGGLAEVAEIRVQVPLPETADELCAVARELGVPDSDIWLGARASERDIKRLSDSGELAAYRIVHFATHGALAGELKAGSEPGLILTPPGEATPEDDGYLSASEIAGLKLDADWVMLSACNTAAGGAPGAEALSGMARAFFYAGARSILASHWAVESDSTVKLITNALSIMSADKSIGRAEAMRRSMVAMIENGEPYQVHPAYWAPFVVVGEGSAPNRAASAVMAPAAPVLVSPTDTKKTARKPRSKGQPWTAEIWKR